MSDSVFFLKEKNLSMAELLQWKHFGRPIENTTLEVRYISVLQLEEE